jgi:hypothetical protein
MKTNINCTLWTGALVVSICSALTSTAAAQSFDQIPGFLTKIAVGNQTVVGIPIRLSPTTLLPTRFNRYRASLSLSPLAGAPWYNRMRCGH